MATLLEQVEVDTELRPAIAGRNPWALAAPRLWRNRIAMAATNPSGAAALWTQVDHADTDAGPWVDLFNPKQIDVLSHNVHGYSWSPQWYILIDRLWLS